MPYEIHNSGGKWIVINPENGHVFGRHDSQEEARAQQKALYANAPEKAEKTVIEHRVGTATPFTWWPK